MKIEELVSGESASIEIGDEISARGMKSLYGSVPLINNQCQTTEEIESHLSKEKSTKTLCGEIELLKSSIHQQNADLIIAELEDTNTSEK